MTFHRLTRHLSLPLVTSICMNVTLAGALVMLWEKREPAALPPPPPPAPRPAMAETKTRPLKSLAASPAPFHWSQLEAPDFPSFVKNLRGIGCPEATIRDIVQCEMNEIYAGKRQEIERAITAAPHQTRAALEARLQQMNAEEAAMLSATLSSTPAAAMTAGGPPAQTFTNEPGAGAMAGGPGMAATAAASTLTPTAFLVGNAPNQATPAGTLSPTPTDASMNAATTAVISQMRSDFATALQGAGADPSSPVYRQRWVTAQQASDEQFSSLFGGDNFIKTQLEAVRAAATNSATRKP